MTAGPWEAGNLRLVGAGCGGEASSLSARNSGQELSQSDARWVLAVRVAASLDGHSAAILSPQKREQILKMASALGLRAFDANLIIAIVQDSVRCGLEPLGRSTADRLTMVPDARRAEPEPGFWDWAMRVAWGSVLGVVGATILIWLVGA